MALLEIRQLRKQYEGFTLEVDRLDLDAGQVLAIVGENGAGKTTFLRCVSGFTPTFEGSVTMGGDLAAAYWRSGGLAYMTEEVRLIEEATVGDHLDLARSISPSWDDSLASSLTAKFRVDLNKKASSLSRGNRVKVALLVALAKRPSLLLLDEPTSGLDPIVRDLVLDELRTVSRGGCATLLSSHILDDFRELADNVVVLKDGRIRSIFENPGDSDRLRDRVVKSLR